jgi:hypothetical protein
MAAPSTAFMAVFPLYRGQVPCVAVYSRMGPPVVMLLGSTTVWHEAIAGA